MANPIVVFFVPHRFSIGSESVGVRATGDKDCPAQAECEYELLLLDDSINWREEHDTPCRMNTSEPLLIVEHKNSTQNVGPWNELFGVNSLLNVCIYFSHYEGDHVFDSVVDIWTSSTSDTGALEKFVQECRDVNILQALDGLAAVCQVKILDPSEEEDEEDTDLLDLEEKFLHMCPAIQKNYIYNTESGKVNTPIQRLSIIRRAAEEQLRISQERGSGSSCDGA